jgi:hypothetical protein
LILSIMIYISCIYLTFYEVINNQIFKKKKQIGCVAFDLPCQ